MLILALHLHIHLPHHIEGPAIDYVGISIASFLSWFGLPGPGEPVLIAAATEAAKDKLDITPVVVIACLGAIVGGLLGWLAGWFAGRSVLTAPGPFRKARQRAADRGEELFKRREVLAILLTPAWVAGINRAGWVVFNVVNTVTAVLWAVGIGVGAYYVGPVVLEVGQDVGLVASVVLVVFVVVGGGGELIRRRRRAPRRGRRGRALEDPARQAEGSVSD